MAPRPNEVFFCCRLRSWPAIVRRGSQMMPDEMRAKALECEQKACAAQNAGVGRMYTELAAQWRELADQIDRNNP